MPPIPRDRPLVVARLKADAPDPGYAVYCEAYGLEMQFDRDWPVTLVLLAPPEHLGKVTASTDVQSLGVQVGVTNCPGHGPPAASWVLVENDRGKLDAALAAGCTCVVIGFDLSGLNTEEVNRVAVVAAADDVGRLRMSSGAAVLLAGGSAAECRRVQADGVYLDDYFETVLRVCKEFGRAG